MCLQKVYMNIAIVTDTDKIIDKAYATAIKHAIDRLEVNFLAGVNNRVTLKEFKDWLKEKENGGE